MPAYNFKKDFAQKVSSGAKRQTIRLPRKRRTVVGDTLYLYTSMRTKDCRKLRVETCRFVLRIVITSMHVYLDKAFMHKELFAYRDGFESWQKMKDFFDRQYGLPFEGECIFW